MGATPFGLAACEHRWACRENNQHGCAGPVGPENSLAHHSIWRTVQGHAPRARARYRSRTMVVKEKMSGGIQMLGPSGGQQNSILIVGRTELPFGER